MQTLGHLFWMVSSVLGAGRGESAEAAHMPQPARPQDTMDRVLTPASMPGNPALSTLHPRGGVSAGVCAWSPFGDSSLALLVHCWARGYVVQPPALPTHPGGPSGGVLLGEPGHRGAGSVGMSWTGLCQVPDPRELSPALPVSGPSGRNVRACLPEAPRPTLGLLPPGAGADRKRHRTGAWGRGSKVSPPPVHLCSVRACAG